MINVINAIQVITGNNNLMEILMDNVYARMVIMIIIKIIVYANNVQHFGFFFFLLHYLLKALFASLFYLMTN